VDVTVSVQEYVVGFYIAVDDVVAVNISQSTGQLCYPKANCILCKGLSRNVKTQIASAHEVDDKVPDKKNHVSIEGSVNGCSAYTYMYSISWKLYRKLQMNG